MRKKNKFELTKGEESLMELFWDASKPLSSIDLSEMTDEFNDPYIHKLLRSLQEKNMLQVSGVTQSGKKYARLFLPTITREEYGAFLMNQIGIKNGLSFAKVAIALNGQNELSNEELIQQLELIVNELKKESNA